MSDDSDELLTIKGNPLEDTGDTWQGGSHHAFNVAYEELKHRYNDLQDRYRVLARQMRGSRAGLEDENLFVRVSPSPQSQGPSSGGPSNSLDSHIQVLHLQQTLALRDREIEELRHQLESKKESDKRVLELQKENDQLLKLNHDLTYNNSDQITKQLKDVNRQLEMTREELSVLQKDYNAVLQENDTLLKKNLYLEQRMQDRSSVSPAKTFLSNGDLSPVEKMDGQDSEMDADDLQQMVVMSMSSKDEMARLKEKVWKLNEVIRILLRQQNERPSGLKLPGLRMNGDVSMPTGLGARPKIRSNVPSVPELSRYAAEGDDDMEDSLKVRRSQSMQYKKKPKNLELRSRGVDASHSRPKSNIEYTRYHIDTDRGKGHVKYTTHIKLQEDITEIDLSRDKREKNVFRSEQNRTRPLIDPRKGSQSELGVSVFDREDLPASEIITGGNRIDDILENSFEDDLKILGSDSLVCKLPDDDITEEMSPEPDEFLTLTPAEQMQFEPQEPPESPSWENRNNRRSQVTPNSQTRGNGSGNPRPLNIDRNECDRTSRSYDNNQGLNVNLNTSKDKFNNPHSPQGFSILNNDPLVGNKTIPSKNIYQETTDPSRPPPSPRVGARPSRTAQEHDDPVVLQTCPICSENFESSVTLGEFEAHVDECIARNNTEDDDSLVLQEREERMCPMCNKVFSDAVPQSEFEVHVNDHFDLNFEIVPNSEA